MRSASLEPIVTSGQELRVPRRPPILDNVVNEREKIEFADRLNTICDERGIPPKGQARQVTLAKILQVSQKGARKWLEGEGFPSTARAIEIARWGRVSYEWLMTGRGNKYPTTEVKERTAQALQIFDTLPDARAAEAVRILAILAGTEGADSVTQTLPPIVLVDSDTGVSRHFQKKSEGTSRGRTDQPRPKTRKKRGY